MQSWHNYLQNCCCCSCCHLELLLICHCMRLFSSWWHDCLRNVPCCDGGWHGHLIRFCLICFSSTTAPHSQPESGMVPLLLAGCSVPLHSSGHS